MSKKPKKAETEAVVGDIPTHPVKAVAGNVGAHVHNNKKVILPLVLVAIIVIVVAAGLPFWRRYQKTHNISPCSNQAKTGVLSDAAKALNPVDVSKLQPVVKQIEATPNYQQYPSCMAVLTTYYFNISDNKKSQSSYDQLVKVYKDKDGYNPLVSQYVNTPKRLKPMVDFLNQRVKDVQQNSTNNYPILVPAQ